MDLEDNVKKELIIISSCLLSSNLILLLVFFFMGVWGFKFIVFSNIEEFVDNCKDLLIMKDILVFFNFFLFGGDIGFEVRISIDKVFRFGVFCIDLVNFIVGVLGNFLILIIIV